MRWCALLLLCGGLMAAGTAVAEPCVTQSQMQPGDREALLKAAMNLATLTEANNTDGVKALTMAQFAQDFGGIAGAIHDAAPHLQGASFVPNTLWVLDASASKLGPDGSPQDTQFFCTLKGGLQTSFLIPALPPGKYGLVMLDTAGTSDPWQVALLLREKTPGTWELGGLFPRATTAAGHDGLWFWKSARDYSGKKMPWDAYVYYNEAEALLKPVSFVSSSHLDKLYDERTKAAPAALSGGIGNDQPLVIAGQKGEVRVTSLGAAAAPDKSGIDLLAHVKATEALADPVAMRARNAEAARAIVAAYPELKTAFHGVWVVADLPGGGTYLSEEPMGTL